MLRSLGAQGFGAQGLRVWGLGFRAQGSKVLGFWGFGVLSGSRRLGVVGEGSPRRR